MSHHSRDAKSTLDISVILHLLLLLRGVLLVSFNLELVTLSELVNYIATDVAKLHLIEDLDKVVVGCLVRSLDDHTRSVLSILDFGKTFLIFFYISYNPTVCSGLYKWS